MITTIIIIITIVISFVALRNRDWFEKLLLSPYNIVYKKEWYRFITHGFIHVDYFHLAVNMMVLYSFGAAVESGFISITPFPMLHFIILYFGSMVFACFSTVKKYKDVYNYASVGASGAVSGVLFAYVLMQPWNKLWFMGIIPIPGVVFAPLYLWYCSYMGRKAGDNVNHDAHFYGALFGFVYPIFVDPYLLSNFIQELFRFF